MKDRPPAPDLPAELPASKVGHYEITSVLGQGGMGTVFRARDLNLGRQVALKRPLPDLAADADARRRFMQEARAASSLSHPNVVPIFEVFEHEGTPWLAMELVEGESLRAVLQRRGMLPLMEVLDYAVGLADALQAAHAKNILHRDVNPRNVLIGTDGRARLSDFGLARRYIVPGSESSAVTESAGGTQPGGVVGTPGYMSPEQALGRAVDPRSDLFSLGAVIYEMCTGRPAFSSSTRGEALDAVLHREPDAIARFNYEIPVEIERIVRKCLAKLPEERYQHASDLIVDLRAFRRTVPTSDLQSFRAAEAPGRPWRRALVGLTGAALLAVAAAVTWVLWPRPAPATPVRETRAAVAVLPFEDRTGQMDGEIRARMVADLLTAELAESRGLRSLGAGRVQEILADLPPSEPAKGRLRRVTEAATVDWIVTGTLYQEAGIYQAAVSVFRPGMSDPQTSFRLSAARTTALADLAAAKLRETLTPRSRQEDEGAEASSLTSSSEEARLQAFRGTAALRERRYEEAIASLGKAIETDPGYTAAVITLTEALHRAGYGRRALEAADRATLLVDHAGLPADARLALEAQAIRSRVRADLPEELKARRALAERYPDEPEMLIGLAEALSSIGKADEALAIVERALALDPKSAPTLLLRARLMGILKRYEEAESDLAKTETMFASLESRAGAALVQQARGNLEYARQAYPAAARHYTAAADLYRDLGLAVKEAELRKSEGDAELRQGNLGAARAHYEEAMAAARIAGDHQLIARALGSLGGQLYLKGDYEGAEKALRQAVDEARQIENSQLILVPLINLADLLGSTGRVGESRGLAAEAVQVARERNDRGREASALSIVAYADYQQGRQAEAVSAYRDLVRLRRGEGGSKDSLAKSLASLALILEAAGPSREALEAVNEAVEIDRAGGSRPDLAYVLVIRARIRGQLALWDDATADIKEAEEIARSGKEKIETVIHSAGLVRGLLLTMQGQWAGAEPRLEEARRAGAATGGVGLEVPALVGLSRVALERKDPARAVRLARQALDHPKAQGEEPTSARAVLASALAATGDGSSAAREARRALDEAETMGLWLVAAKAAQVLASLPAAHRPSDMEQIEKRGREALGKLLEAAPEDRRAAIRSRPDIEYLFANLDPAPAGPAADPN